jgi:hypothetical protein
MYPPHSVFYFIQESDHEQKHSDSFGLALAIVRADGRELTPRGLRGGNPDLPLMTCPPRPRLPRIRPLTLSPPLLS